MFLKMQILWYVTLCRRYVPEDANFVVCYILSQICFWRCKFCGMLHFVADMFLKMQILWYVTFCRRYVPEDANFVVCYILSQICFWRCKFCGMLRCAERQQSLACRWGHFDPPKRWLTIYQSIPRTIPEDFYLKDLKHYWLTGYGVVQSSKRGYAVVQLVEARRWKSEGCGFDSWWCHWNFSLTQSLRPHYGPWGWLSL